MYSPEFGKKIVKRFAKLRGTFDLVKDVERFRAKAEWVEAIGATRGAVKPDRV